MATSAGRDFLSTASGRDAGALAGIRAADIAAITALKMRRLTSDVIFLDIVRFIEFVMIMAIGLATCRETGIPMPGLFSRAVIALVLVSVSFILVMQRLGTFRICAFSAPTRVAMRIALAWINVLACAMLLALALWPVPDTAERWLVAWGALGFVALAVERTLLFGITAYLLRRHKLGQHVVIVGGGSAAYALLDVLFAQRMSDMHIVGLFDDRQDHRSPDVVCGVPKLGTVDDLVDFARQAPIDVIIFALPCTAEDRLVSLLDKLWVLPVDIKVAAHANLLRYVRRTYSYIGTCPLIDLVDKPIPDRKLVLKSMLDKVVGLALLVLLAPVALVVAIAIKLDSRGPVLFRQMRYGFNNQKIEVLKFRSMHVDQLDFKADRLVTVRDPRVTRVGRFIRRTSLDELPQLFDVVFKGNLSLVGPRPHAINAKVADRRYDEVVATYFARHRVRPGVTGWAQINDWRGETDTLDKIEARTRFDLYYIQNWSIFLDLYVLLRTPFSLLNSKNAY